MLDFCSHTRKRFCGDEEKTFDHLLCECDVFANIRTNLVGSSIINDGEGSKIDSETDQILETGGTIGSA